MSISLAPVTPREPADGAMEPIAVELLINSNREMWVSPLMYMADTDSLIHSIRKIKKVSPSFKFIQLLFDRYLHCLSLGL